MDRTILIIEDEQKINDILAFSLGKDGYKTLSAFDGVKGLEMALKENPDLILLDVMLPGMDGFEVCRKVREKSQVPIIMLTALSDEENQLRGFEQQIDDYIPKPFSPKILLCKIAAILRRRTAENHNQSLLTYKELRMDIDGFHVYQSGKYDGQGVFHEFTQESVDAMGRCSPIIMNQEKDTGILKVQFNVRYILFYCQNLLRLKLLLF